MGSYYNLEIYNKGYNIYKAKSPFEILSMTEKGSNNIKKTIKNKNLNVVIVGESITINKLKINKVKYKDIDKIVKNTVISKFNNIEDVIYDYVVFEDTIVIYIVNGSGLKEIRNLILKNKIMKVLPIQFCILEELRKSIKESKYNIIAKHDNHIYLLKVDSHVLVENHIREINSMEEERENLNIILEFESKINDRGIYLYGTNEVINDEVIREFKDVKVI